jgi:hypothetical protein
MSSNTSSRQNEVVFVTLTTMYASTAALNAVCNILVFIIVHRDKIINTKPGIALVGVLSISDSVVGIAGVTLCANKALLYYAQVGVFIQCS